MFDCTLSVCVCVTVTGSYQDKAQPAVQGCRGHRGEGETGVCGYSNEIHCFPFSLSSFSFRSLYLLMFVFTHFSPFLFQLLS